MSEESLANKSQPPSALPETEYDIIHATVSETAQGRRFLQEYARRCRPSETEATLATIERMQAAIRHGGTSERLELLLEIADMAQAIVRLRAEIVAMKPPGGGPPRQGWPPAAADELRAASTDGPSDPAPPMVMSCGPA